MALIDLKSNLSWYSSNGKPPGYRPNPDRSTTNYVNNDDLTVSATPRGFDNNGSAITFTPRTSANEFLIDNNSTSFRGNASRLAQLGNGSKFPLGPQGQVFEFDRPRTGFNVKTKYSETFSALSNAGLADTYVLRKPIDAMYNKFKVRDQVYNPYGDPAPPFILRGIQKDDSIDPERYGPAGFSPDTPRGGPITAALRAELDVERIRKFMARPAGQWFIAKQNQLHLMYPNREGVDGRPQSPAYNANSPKVFDVQNLINQVGKVWKGEHDRKHGQFPYDTPGFLPFPPSPPSNYEDIHKERNIGLTQSGRRVSPTLNNRLVILRRESMWDSKTGWIEGTGLGQGFGNLSDKLGPNSITFDGQVKDTIVRRWVSTIPNATAEIPIGGQYGVGITAKFSSYRANLYSYLFPYYSRTITLNTFGIRFRAEGKNTDLEGPYKGRDSLERRYTKLLSDSNRKWNAHENDRDFIAQPYDGDRRVRPDDIIDPQSYSLIQKGNDLRLNAGPGRDKIVDFRAGRLSKSNEIKEDPYTAFRFESDTAHNPGTVERNESMLRLLREDIKTGDTAPDGVRGKFNGRGITHRAINDGPNDASKVQERDPITGKWKTPTEAQSSRTSEDEYIALGQAARDRRENANTVLDFREDPTNKGERYNAYIGINTGDEGTTDTSYQRIKGKDFDGFRDPQKTVPDRNPATAEPPSEGNISLQKYKTMRYDQIRSTAGSRQLNYKNPQIVDFRKAGAKLEAKLARYNEQVNTSELVPFKIGSLSFKAYITSISDNFSAGLNGESDQNRADPRYLYTSFERSVSISFIIAYEKSNESPWEKIRQLAQYSLPGYGGGPWAQAVNVTIGKLYRNIPMTMESISYDWDNETPWSLKDDQANIEDGLPMYTNVDIQFKYLGNVKPAKGKGYVLYGK
jgi:hypothetical protein